MHQNALALTFLQSIDLVWENVLGNVKKTVGKLYIKSLYINCFKIKPTLHNIH